MKVYKLTNQIMQTYGGFQWQLGQTRKAPGTGELCSAGWLHCCSDPLLAVFLNPIHAAIDGPRLFEGEASGAAKDDNGLKLGVERLKLTAELPLPVVTPEQRIRFAILCALEVCKDKGFSDWAANWLSGKDRSAAAARKAAAAAEAWASAWAAAEAAAAAAAEAEARKAEWAASAAEWAAWAAEWAARASVKPLDILALAKKAVAE